MSRYYTFPTNSSNAFNLCVKIRLKKFKGRETEIPCTRIHSVSPRRLLYTVYFHLLLETAETLKKAIIIALHPI